MDALLRKEPELGFSAREAASRSLAKLGPVLDAARLRTLIEALERGEVRYFIPEILVTLGNNGSQHPKIATLLMDRLTRGTNESIHKGAAQGLAAMGEHAQPLHEALLALYRKDAAPGRKTLIVALGGPGVVADLLLDELRDDLTSTTPRRVYKAALICAELEAHAAPLLPELLPLLSSEPSRRATTRAAMGAIRHAGEAARDAVPKLIGLLDRYDDRDDLFYVVIALSYLGPNASEALPALKRLKHHHEEQGWATGTIIRAIASVSR